jgi:hypothetical protein
VRRSNFLELTTTNRESGLAFTFVSVALPMDVLSAFRNKSGSATTASRYIFEVTMLAGLHMTSEVKWRPTTSLMAQEGK